MPIVAIFSSVYTTGSEIAAEVAKRLDCELIKDQLLKDVSDQFGVSLSSLDKTLRGQTSFFNNLTHQWEKNLDYFKAAVANRLKITDLVFYTKAALIIPQNISHVMRVDIVADHSFRVNRAMELKNLSRKAAERAIETEDAIWRKWSQVLFHGNPKGSPPADLKIPIHATAKEEAVEMIVANAGKPALAPTEESIQAAMDFMLAMRINATLAREGYHYCDVESDNGDVKVIINQNVLRLEKLESELTQQVRAMEGVKSVKTEVGPKFNKPDIAVKFDFELPSHKEPNVLLVDDEQEYVTTLSERLGMREFPADVVLNGEQALSYIEEHQPDVMVLDLRMPGIGGVETLRRVKRDYPEVEVIVLTGHGTDKDKKVVLDLGAFAYLEKPVAIDVLAKTLERARKAAKSNTEE